MLAVYLATGAAGAVAANQLGLQTGLPTSLQFVVLFFAITISSSVVDYLYFQWSWTQKEKAAGCKPPFVRKNALPGGIDQIRRMQAADRNKEVPEELARIHNEIHPHNTWQQSFFGKAQIFTVEPKNIQAILATQFREFDLGEMRRNNFFPLLGNGIFTADGKSWEHSRALLRPQFIRDQVADLDLEEYHIQNMLKHLPAGSDGWTTEVDFSPLLFRLTLDSATEFLFGHSTLSQIAALPEGSPEKHYQLNDSGLNGAVVAESFDSAMGHISKRVRYNELYWLHSPAEFHQDCRKVHRFADFYVNKALQESDSSQAEKAEGDGRYVFLKELVKTTRDPVEIRSQLLNILLAGRDTTAGLLGWTFWLLLRHPATFQKLRKVIIDEFGTYEKPQNITFATLKSCTYLQHVMNEVLRLYPSVSVNARRANKDTTIPCGGGPDGKSPVFIPKNHEVVYSVHVMHRRKDLWGEDADEFRPERWVGRKNGWDYLPFNGGPRICLGQQFALTEAGYVLTRLLQKYDIIESMDASNVPKHQFSVTTAPLAVKMRFHEAK